MVIGRQETWIIPDDPKDFLKMLDAYHNCSGSGYYSEPSNNAAEPRSVVFLKKRIQDIPAGAALMWAVGERNRHDAQGLFAGALAEDVKLKVVPIEDVLRPECDEMAGIDLDIETPTENEYMKRFDISKLELPKELEPKELPDNVKPFPAEKSDVAPLTPTQAAKAGTGPVSEPVTRFEAAQIWMIEQGMEKGLDVAVYADTRYNWRQMHVIKSGMERGLDISALRDPEYSHEQMGAILRGLRQGFDISIYADKKYRAEQMNEIAAGMESGVNVNQYADPRYTWLQMMEIRKGLESGADVSVYRNPAFTDSQMRQFRSALTANQAAKPDRAFIRFPLLERALTKAKDRIDEKISNWLNKAINRPKKKRTYER
jgi:hypothetical protein